jgi:hypothetical protein
MKLDIVCKSGSDEYYTPEYAITPILKYISKESKVWCPFDTYESNFVKMLKARGNEVVFTHISKGEDFFNIEEECDVILSNPPYSRKTEVIERLFNLGKPFAMLFGIVGLFESEKRFTLLEQNSFEVMHFNRRVTYFRDFVEQKPSIKPPFASVYLCSKLLPKQIVFERINKTRTNLTEV